MNIKITHHWLLEYLDTDASPFEIQKYLSLAGPSVERVEKVGDDYLYEIEVTSNRIDTASVLGIAQEAVAILPEYGKKAKLKINPLEKYLFSTLSAQNNHHPLHIQIKNKDLCSRFTALILDNINIVPAPNLMRNRLTLCGIKSINNVIDISNYLMLALGQPTHIFDYDKIAGQTMIMRESKKGEKIITLDEKEITLPGTDIVIEDGSGSLIDLCGIMGGLNSAVSPVTKRVVLFVQTYNKDKIRRTSLLTGARTIASTYFEKGLDKERVEPTLVYGTRLLQQYARANIGSKLYDIYPHPYKAKIIKLSTSEAKRLIGVAIDAKKIETILQNLGFEVKKEKDTFKAKVPSYRKPDMEIKEDLVEEIARVYGYENLPGNLPPAALVTQPKDQEALFYLQEKIKYFLKHLGLHEVINYSMISQDLIENLNLKLGDHLELSNTISKEIKYLRITLLPSLIKNIKDNQGKKQELKFFEIGKIYPRHKNDLPDEEYKVGIVTNSDFYDLKGIIEALFSELNITNFQVAPHHNHVLSEHAQGEIFIAGNPVGYFGELKSEYVEKFALKNQIYLAEIDLNALIENAKTFPSYRPVNPYAVIVLDLTLQLKPGITFEKIKKIAFTTSKLLSDIKVIDVYKDKVTLRFYFTSNEKNITEEEAKTELNKTIKELMKLTESE